ncbi:metal-dependent transcriptional regulator [bacterium]|nr:metal-dependent transcriptional regulator [bacterium]
MLTPRTVDYLETIYLLSLQHDTVGVSQVAAGRGVTIPTARSAVNKLKTEGYVRQERYGKVVLTDKGRISATEIYRVHSVLYQFLREVLGVEKERADTEACKLEHGLSTDTVGKLIAFLERNAS